MNKIKYIITGKTNLNISLFERSKLIITVFCILKFYKDNNEILKIEFDLDTPIKLIEEKILLLGLSKEEIDYLYNFVCDLMLDYIQDIGDNLYTNEGDFSPNNLKDN